MLVVSRALKNQAIRAKDLGYIKGSHEKFCFPKHVQIGSGAYPLFSGYQGVFPAGVKCLGHVADHSSASSAEVKK